MSGAFEVAAGAFAVVGVADVLARAGLEVYNFLREVEDAPNDVKRLCDSVEKTVLLANVSTRCLRQLESCTQPAPSPDVVETLRRSRNALEREVKSLKIHTVKFKGKSRRWSNVRHVLNEQRIRKALGSLEQSKSLLNGALIHASRELTGIENQNIEQLIQQFAQQVTAETADLSRTITTKFDANNQALSSRLDAFRQRDLIDQAARRHALNSKLDAHHQELTTAHKSQQNSLSAIQHAQKNTVSFQNQVIRASVRSSAQTARVSRDLRLHTRASDKQHQKTRELIVGLIQTPRLSTVARSGRQIVYSGEQRDLIVPALYFIKKDVLKALDQLYERHCDDLSPRHIAWLESEFRNLEASADQERALTHRKSTATSTDTWIYPLEQQRESNYPEEQSAVAVSDISLKSHSVVKNERLAVQIPQRNGYWRSHRLLLFRTSNGILKLRIPYKTTAEDAADTREEVSLSFISSTSGPFDVLNACFIRISDRLSAPSICTQLNVFLPLDGSQSEAYELLITNTNIEDFDRMIRDGSLSPYRVDVDYGYNVLFTCMVGHCRIDLMDHLESQGVHYDGLRQYSSVVIGLWMASDEDNSYDFGKADAIISRSRETSALLADLTMMSLCYFLISSECTRWLHFRVCLVKLQRLDYKADLFKQVFGYQNLETLEWRTELLPDVVRLLLESGADPNTIWYGRFAYLTVFLKFMSPNQGLVCSQNHNIRKQVLSAFIEAEADVFYRNMEGESLSGLARIFNHWDAWCEALQENGKNIEEIVRSQGEEWLLDDSNFPQSFYDTDGSEDLSEYTSEDESEDAGTTDDEAENKEQDNSPEEKHIGRRASI